MERLLEIVTASKLAKELANTDFDSIHMKLIIIKYPTLVWEDFAHAMNNEFEYYGKDAINSCYVEFQAAKSHVAK